MKICLNCGDKLLDAAKKCPTCKTKDKGFPIVDSNDKDTINRIIASVPNPKDLTAIKQDLEQRKQIEAMEKDGIAYCPKCHSTSLSANKKGFGIGKAIVGAWAAGPIGLAAGNIGAKKIEITCLKCGHQFKAGCK